MHERKIVLYLVKACPQPTSDTAGHETQFAWQIECPCGVSDQTGLLHCPVRGDRHRGQGIHAVPVGHALHHFNMIPEIVPHAQTTSVCTVLEPYSTGQQHW